MNTRQQSQGCPAALTLAIVCVVAGAIGCDGYMVMENPSDGEGTHPQNSDRRVDESGGDGTSGTSDSVHDDSSPPEMQRPTAVGIGGLKRLTRLEYDNTLKQLFGPPLGDQKAFGEQLLPGTSPKPFSNDFLRQKPSDHLVERLKESAEKAAGRIVEELKAGDATRRYVLGCEPSGPEDADCFRTFLEIFLRRAYRRPVSSDQVERLMRRFFELAPLRERAETTGDDELLEAVDGATFYDKVQMAIEAILQQPRFIYRRESGERAPELSDGERTVWKLDDYAIASRLAYFLTGSPPDDQLLEAAAQGELETGAQVRDEAARLLETPAARERMYQFHAAWLHFQDFWLGRNNREVPEARAEAMRTETRTLFERVLFGDEATSWLKLFRAERTWVEPELADYYEFVDREQVAGESEDNDGAWIRYPDESLRRGILSHGSFLTNGRRQNGETHIIRRSEVILHRLMCDSVPPPPDDAPSNVDDAAGGDEASCKVDKLDAATLVEGCQSCHYRLNKLGGALENFDNRGRYREYRSDDQDCRIEGQGGLYEHKSAGWTKTKGFRGPGGLSETLIETFDVAGCMVKHLYEFALGHADLSEGDRAAISRLRTSFEESGYRFRQLVLELVSSKAFRYRIERRDDER